VLPFLQELPSFAKLQHAPESGLGRRGGAMRQSPPDPPESTKDRIMPHIAYNTISNSTAKNV
jgi:hypothetical protein